MPQYIIFQLILKCNKTLFVDESSYWQLQASSHNKLKRGHDDNATPSSCLRQKRHHAPDLPMAWSDQLPATRCRQPARRSKQHIYHPMVDRNAIKQTHSMVHVRHKATAVDVLQENCCCCSIEQQQMLLFCGCYFSWAPIYSVENMLEKIAHRKQTWKTVVIELPSTQREHLRLCSNWAHLCALCHLHHRGQSIALHE